ncbi:MAG: hypothetical protein U5R06_15360 [candidate division KSB1 bacterium]|nr:hypothetical protein [candidate division KSB1 bacterium]
MRAHTGKQLQPFENRADIRVTVAFVRHQANRILIFNLSQHLAGNTHIHMLRFDKDYIHT